jgi:hypothetical protein
LLYEVEYEWIHWLWTDFFSFVLWMLPGKRPSCYRERPSLCFVKFKFPNKLFIIWTSDFFFGLVNFPFK